MHLNERMAKKINWYRVLKYILRSIDTTVSISTFQTKFNKKINRFMQSKLLNLEMKERK
jgi:hypothetical protein